MLIPSILILSFLAAIQITSQDPEEPDTPISGTEVDFFRSVGTKSSSDFVKRRGNKESLGPSCTVPIRSCISLTKCDELYKIAKKGELNMTSEERQILRNHTCGWVGKAPKVCCDDYLERVSHNTAEKPLSTFAACGDNIFNIKTIVGTKSKPRITGDGKPTLLGSWPWMAALYYTRTSWSGIAACQCGGSLISNEWVLTAGHCVPAKNSEMELSFVVLGDLDLNMNVEDGAQPIEVPIAQAIRHPQYVDNQKAPLNDIALLKLSTPVEYNTHIQPICLHGDPKYFDDDFYKDKKPSIAGWGYTNATTKRRTTHLLEAEVPVVSITKCKQNYKGSSFVKINESVICAGKGGEDACQGDSGGPLMFKDYRTNIWSQGGIVSFGKGCGVKDYPGVYTRVPAFADWIEETTKLKF